MPDNVPPLDVSNFNIAIACIGGFLTVFGLVSYLLKEHFYLSEALISVLAGVVFSPPATNWIRPEAYSLYNAENLEIINLYFTRLVLDVQLVIAGIQLPAKYLRTEWKSLSIVLGPGMCAMWISTTLIVWAMVPNLPFLHALAVASCVTPTDPILANSIVKGKFADENIPKELQNLIVAESGANDGLGYPFLFIALYLIKYTHYDGGDTVLGTTGGAGKAIGYWFGITWAYIIIMGVLWGVVCGYTFRVALKWAEKKKYVDRESFIVFAVSLALFIGGTGGMVGTDDVLASFIAGCVFTWDGWFNSKTADDSFQATTDMLLNVAIFIWFGAVCPWNLFAHNDTIPIYRLIFLGILIMLVRRMPFVAVAHNYIHQIHDWRRNFFMGFFGPIGVSAIFYLYVSLDFLRSITVAEHEREDAERLGETFTIVVWFMAITSIVVHGMAVPLAKFMFVIPKSLSRSNTNSVPFRTTPGSQGGSRAATTTDEEAAFGTQEKSTSLQKFRRAFTFTSSKTTRTEKHHSNINHGPAYRIGGSIIPGSEADPLPLGSRRSSVLSDRALSARPNLAEDLPRTTRRSIDSAEDLKHEKSLDAVASANGDVNESGGTSTTTSTTLTHPEERQTGQLPRSRTIRIDDGVAVTR